MDIKYFTPKEVASMMGVSYSTVMRLIRSDKLPFIKFGASWRISESDLRQVLAKARTNHDSKG